MAYTAAQFHCVFSAGPGRSIYTYHADATSDTWATIETAGYFNNSDDNLNLAPGDLIHCVFWDGAVHTAGQRPNGYSLQVVTTVDPAGVVNTAEAGVSTVASISSGA